MKTKQAGLGLLGFGIFLIGLTIFLTFNPTVAEWANLRAMTVYFGTALPLMDTILYGLWKIVGYAPICALMSIVLGVGFILL